MEKWFLTLLILLLLHLSPAKAMDLTQYLDEVKIKHGLFKAYKSSEEASSYKRVSGDIGLSPILTAKLSYLDDKSTQSLGTYILNHNKTKEISLGVAKKFASGTQTSLSASVNEMNIDANIMASVLPPITIPYSSTLASSALIFNISQSLWKDSFGRATGLRHEREALIEATEKKSLDLQSQQVLIEAEVVFWDLVYFQNELLQREDSLQRAQRIEGWVKRRLENGIGDRADLLNAQGLLSLRKLSLLSSKDDLLAAQKKVKDMLELNASQEAPTLVGDLDQMRDLRKFIHILKPNNSNSSNQNNDKDSRENKNEKIVRLDTYLLALEAKLKKIISLEVQDSFKPDLLLEGMIKENGSDSSMGEVAGKLTDTSKPTMAIALKLNLLLDGDLKGAALNSAKADALASQYKKERKLLESETLWQEMLRRHRELSNKITIAQEMSRIQLEKAAAERDKLSKGRSITMQVINAEQDAAEAQLTLIKMKTEQRKIEAQGRLFVLTEEAL